MFAKSERGIRHIEQHKTDRGYNLIANALELCAGDEIAFPYGNNVFRAVIAFVGTLPNKHRYVVLNQAVDLNVWQQKDLTQSEAGMYQYVFTLQELAKMEILKKSIPDEKYVQKLLNFYRQAFLLMGHINYAM